MEDLTIAIVGSGGDGVVSGGEVLISAAASLGYHGVMTKSFGPQIRGGESSCRVRLSNTRVHNPGGALHAVIVLNWNDYLKFGAEMHVSEHTLFIYDEKTRVQPNELPLEGLRPRHVVAVPIATLAKEATGSEKARTSVVLGLISVWFGLESDALMAGLLKKFGRKGETVVATTIAALEKGAAYASAHPLAHPHLLDPPMERTPKFLADGNDLCAAAAIYVGCEFFGGYPITPSTEIMQFFSREVWKYGGSVLQAEDEIAGIGAALGASFAGKKAMTATSGPGLALKTEILGLASVAELPLVIVDVQRGGPSTGIPTKVEQSDLFAAAFSATGDVLRPVLAPTCVSDTPEVTVEAFNIAETYQTPVIILSDQEIGQRKEIVEPIDPRRFRVLERRRPSDDELTRYERFRLEASGVSPLSHPGMPGGNYLVAGIEHDSLGRPTSNGDIHATMNAKRFDKLAPLRSRDDLFSIEGNPDAPLALIAWGSSAGVCREAVEMACSAGIDVKLLAPRLLYPIAESVYEAFFAEVFAGLVVELSHQGQLYRILRMFVDVPMGIESCCRSGANPFQPSELLARLRVLDAQLQTIRHKEAV